MCVFRPSLIKLGVGDVDRHSLGYGRLGEIRSAKAVLHLEELVNFCPCFPNILTDLGEIRYQRSANGTVERL